MAEGLGKFPAGLDGRTDPTVLRLCLGPGGIVLQLNVDGPG